MKRLLLALALLLAPLRADIDTVDGVATSTLSKIDGQTVAAGGGPTSPGTTSLVAWYDMNTSGTAADLVNKHNSGTFDLTVATGTPTYTSGYGISTSSPAANWSETALDGTWFATEGDASFTIRFQGKTGIVNGDYIYTSHNGKVNLRWITAGFRVNFGGVTHDATTNPATDTWYTLTANYTASSDTTEVFLQSVSEGSTAGVYSDGDLTNYWGGDSTAQDTWLDFFCAYDRLMTQDEIDWLYNSGSTRVYGDL